MKFLKNNPKTFGYSLSQQIFIKHILCTGTDKDPFLSLGADILVVRHIMNNKHNKRSITGMLEDKCYVNKKSAGKGEPNVPGVGKASCSIN